AFCIRYRLAFTATYRYKQLLFFSHRLTLAKIQIIKEKSKMRQIPRRCRPVADRPAGSTFLKYEQLSTTTT
ncbi:hypothetical protein SEEE5621_18031, partial [Salmonella enterica subsp. enterica serovar Enteritidis str. 6.0562-1]